MILYGKNGKMKATYLVGKLLFEENVYLLDNDVRFLNHRHKIRDIHFSEKIKNDPELCACFSECIHTLGSLFYFLENDKSLQMDLAAIDPKIYPLIRHEDLTGITALLLFQKKLLEISDESDFYYALDVAPEVYDNIKNPEEYFRNLILALLRFNGEETKNVRVLIRRKNEEVKKEDGLSVAFGGTDIKEALTERERNVRKNAEHALKRIQKTMGNMIASNKENKRTLENRSITFFLRNTVRFNDISFMIPDGFKGKESENEFVGWLPNDENPEAPDASMFLFSVKPEIPEKGLNFKPYQFERNGQNYQVNFQVSKILESDFSVEKWKEQILEKFRNDRS